MRPITVKSEFRRISVSFIAHSLQWLIRCEFLTSLRIRSGKHCGHNACVKYPRKFDMMAIRLSQRTLKTIIKNRKTVSHRYMPVPVVQSRFEDGQSVCKPLLRLWCLKLSGLSRLAFPMQAHPTMFGFNMKLRWGQKPIATFRYKFLTITLRSGAHYNLAKRIAPHCTAVSVILCGLRCEKLLSGLRFMGGFSSTVPSI